MRRTGVEQFGLQCVGLSEAAIAMEQDEVHQMQGTLHIISGVRAGKYSRPVQDRSGTAGEPYHLVRNVRTIAGK